MGRRSDPAWRDAAATELILGSLSKLGPTDPVLVAGASLPELAESLLSCGFRCEVWDRRCRGGAEGTPWPVGGPYGTALVRIPRSKDELLMTLHAVSSVLAPAGSVAVYGANDEGIKSCLELLAGLASDARTVATGGRCRVIAGEKSADNAEPVKSALSAWKETGDLGPPPFPPRWTSYPGVFAHGRLDEGTRLLLANLPAFPAGASVLDYGCGSGAVGWEVARTSPGIRLSLLDTDAVALEAARENVPGAHLLLGDGLPTVDGGLFDAIVSNPPFHRGKAEDSGMLVEFVKGAGGLLTPEGQLVFVAQRRMGLEPHLRERFRSVEVLEEDSTFRIWRGHRPIGA